MTSFTTAFSLRPHLPSPTASSSGSILSSPRTYPTLLSTPSLAVRGGKTSHGVSTTANDSHDASTTNFVSPVLKGLISFWAAGGVVMILARAMKRIVPIALEPFGAGAVPLSSFQLVSYIGMCLWFAYVEGYKGFQLKFSPLVVSRSQTLSPSSPIHHLLLAPLYAMGLFHATKKRKIVSWSVSLGVGTIVALVKRLPYPWRNIVDAGVICGLTWGSVSIGWNWVKVVLLGKEVEMDPALPEKK